LPKGQWTALVLAGQRPGGDPLAKAFGQDWKALVPMEGVPMLTRVVRTLAETPEIGRIIVLGQDPEALCAAAEAGGAVTLIASGSGISQSILAVAGGVEAPWPVLVTTADHPLLTHSITSTFISGSGGCDLAIGMVERGVMQRAYPGSPRTWLKFSDGQWSGANLFALNNGACCAALQLWANAEGDRKRAWKLFAHFGTWLMLRAITRTIGLSDALALAGRRLGLSAKLVPLEDAEAAIDVDKPADHALASIILRKREGLRGNAPAL
jgi:GTP:adenosylcobinamide-phosphate guanylyltransferase